MSFNSKSIRQLLSARRTIAFCLTLGFGCMTVFLLIGRRAGSTFFDSAPAGHFIVTLSFLCPFLYLDSTLSSILQGLGKTGPKNSPVFLLRKAR